MPATAQALSEPVYALPATAFESLVVASVPARRTVIETALRRLGSRHIVVASSVYEAGECAVVPMSRDVAVVDSDLADGTAYEAFRLLREAGWRRVVMMSSRDDPLAIVAAGALGVRNYLVVPEHSESGMLMPPRIHDRTAVDSGRLSERELEVLQLVADGMSNKDVARLLGLSALTVKSHLARISRKLQTGDRAEMVAIAMRAGKIR